MTNTIDEFAVTPQQLTHGLDTGEPVVVLDVRRQPAFDKNPVLIAGSLRLSPEQVKTWAGNNRSLAGANVVAYCVHGHEVSQNAAAELRAQGFAAKFLAGGLGGWQAEGRPTSPGTIEPPAT